MHFIYAHIRWIELLLLGSCLLWGRTYCLREWWYWGTCLGVCTPSPVAVNPLLVVELQQKGAHVGLIERDVLQQWFIIVLTSQTIKWKDVGDVQFLDMQALQLGGFMGSGDIPFK
jgi:hypothetical protein